jgi:outer membrane protein insertion porin family
MVQCAVSSKDRWAPGRFELAIGGLKSPSMVNLWRLSPGAGSDRTLHVRLFLMQVTSTETCGGYKLNGISTGLGISWISPVGPLRIASAVHLCGKVIWR